MKIAIAPDSFKGSLTAAQVCAAVADGVRKAAPEAEIICVPMADGGEGTVQSLIDGLGGIVVECETDDPLGRPIKAVYGLTDDGTAVIEMAQASGLTLLSENERDPMKTSTCGTGKLIKDALEWGAREFIIGIGGSATNDGGAGMAQALGYGLFDATDEELPYGGGALAALAYIDGSGADAKIGVSRFTVACDVDNPLCGPRGASAVFGPQKGATPDQVQFLDRALAKLAERMKRDLGRDVADMPGAGAAGGLGAGCMAFLDAKLMRGVDIVIKATGLAEKLSGASLVITGEGRTDSQTLGGKTAFGVAALAKAQGIPVVLISGSISADAEGLLDSLYECGVVRARALMEDGVTLEYAIQNGEALLEARAMSAVLEFLTLRD